MTGAGNIAVPPATQAAAPPNWVANATVLWIHRRLLARVSGFAFFLSLAIALLIPKQYESIARIMPPDPSSYSMLATIAGRLPGGLGALGNLAGGLFGGRASSSLFIDLLHSRTISDHLIDRFNLQSIYRKRYRIDTVKYIARHTTIVDDKKSGVIMISYMDTDAQRARAVTQGYLEELNSIVTRSNTSSARREREFIEARLVGAKADLQTAQLALSDFSSTNTTLDIKEQVHATVDAAAKLQAEVIAGRSELDSLEQIYGNDNVRLKAVRARVAGLTRELAKISGNSDQPSGSTSNNPASADASLYPSLRRLPQLAVPYANLYRSVRIQETLFELLTQQYEMARIEEAKDTPVVSVIDPPLVAEKKSFPPRLLIVLILTSLAFIFTSAWLIAQSLWRQVPPEDSRRRLAHDVSATLHGYLAKYRTHSRETP